MHKDRPRGLSVRWKIILVYLTIIAVAFLLVGLAVNNLASDFMVKQRIDESQAAASDLAVELAPKLYAKDAQALYDVLIKASRDSRTRLMVLSPQGTVMVDVYATLAGTRLGHAEVMDIVLNKADASYGFHKLEDGQWLAYYTTSIVYDAKMIGILFTSVSIQDLVQSVQGIRTTTLIYFLVASVLVVFIGFWASGILTRPINTLNELMAQTVRSGFSVRATPRGNDEIAQLGRTFNLMSERLENTERRRNEFISNASHELKTPLASIRVLSDALLQMDMPDPAVVKEFLSDINGEIDRSTLLINDLLSLVRFDSDAPAAQLERVAFSELTGDTAMRLEQMAMQRSIELQINIDDEYFVMGDALKLSQVIYNLTDNAIKYTPDGGHVTVELTGEGGNALLKVMDTGIGIPKESLNHVFDRFYRVD